MLVAVAALLSAVAAPAYAQESAVEAEVRYPLALPYLDCPQRRCDLLQLVDTELQGGPEGGGGFRLRWGDTAIVGFSWLHDRRLATLDSARLSVRYDGRDDGRVALAAEVRGGGWRLLAESDRASDIDGGTWYAGGQLSLRASGEVEVQATWRQALQDLPDAFVVERTQRSGRLGMRWQRGTHLELGASVSTERVIDGLGESAERWGGELLADWLAGSVGLAGALRYTDSGGRFAEQRLAAALAVDTRIAGHALLRLGASERASIGLAELDRTLRAGASFFGRRYRFSRGGRAAQAADELASQSRAAGYDERLQFDVLGQRAQRERLSMSGARESLRGAIDALYAAEVEDRNVEQLGIDFLEARDLELGSRIRTVGGRVGIPWPLAWPWSRGEDRVEFVRLFGSYTVAEYTEEAREYGRQVGAIVWLNRETFASVRWESPHRTPLDLALGKLGDDWVVAALSWRLGH